MVRKRANVIQQPMNDKRAIISQEPIMNKRTMPSDNTIYVRVPPVIKKHVIEAAGKAGISVNQWMQQLLERTLFESAKAS